MMVSQEARDEARELFRLYKSRLKDDRKETPVSRIRKATKAELMALVRDWGQKQNVDVVPLLRKMQTTSVRLQA